MCLFPLVVLCIACVEIGASYTVRAICAVPLKLAPTFDATCCVAWANGYLLAKLLSVYSTSTWPRNQKVPRVGKGGVQSNKAQETPTKVETKTKQCSRMGTKCVANAIQYCCLAVRSLKQD
eukprot:1077420-Amphidinium_carterae.2